MGKETICRKAVPGSMTQEQVESLISILTESGTADPGLLSDLEGCGPVFELEREFSKRCNSPYTLAVASGTAAIHVALLAAGVKTGDEVITTSYTWTQSLGPILINRSVPVFADISPHTFHIDPDSAADLINPKTKAILVPHLFGHLADMERLSALAEKHGLILISDAAQALGAERHGKTASDWSDMACYSLGRGKLISGGEGGILTFKRREDYEAALLLTQHPHRIKRLVGPGLEPIGLNYRLHPLAALLALVELKQWPAKLHHRRSVFESFMSGLGQVDCLHAQRLIPSLKSACYGIPLTFIGTSRERTDLIDKALQEGLPLTAGPISRPVHLRLGEVNHLPIPKHPNHRPGACPATEEHCRKQELWVLGGLDMDVISIDTAFEMGRGLRKLAVQG